MYAHAEVRGQLAGVSYLFPPHVFWEGTQVFRTDGEYIYPLRHLTSREFPGNLPLSTIPFIKLYNACKNIEKIIRKKNM